MELQRGGAAPLPAHGKARRRGSLPGTANFFACAMPLFDCRQRPSSTQPSGPRQTFGRSLCPHQDPQRATWNTARRGMKTRSASSHSVGWSLPIYQG